MRVMTQKERQPMTAQDKPFVYAWVDGASSGNGGDSGVGVVLTFERENGDMVIREFSEYIGAGMTNNMAELLAIIKALEVLKMPCNIDIRSDSQITVKCAQREYTPKANLGLWNRLDAVMQNGNHSVVFTWVKGHSGLALQERANKLAQDAAKNKRGVAMRDSA